MSSDPYRKIVALAGGVGGAKLLQGLDGAAATGTVTAIVNTADDFRHHGLHISPDLDTVMYTLAGIADPVNGWGIAGDTRATLDAIARYGEDPWFLVGDRDFATHILRTGALHRGDTLTDITRRLASALGITTPILPMTDDAVATEVRTADGWLAFQDYFVARRHADAVLDVRFVGIERARPTERVLAAVAEADLILFCPSNPVVSIGPILGLPGMPEALASARAPIVAVSPIVGGRAIKGPADRMLEALGVEVSARGVAQHYGERIDGIVIDRLDEALAEDVRATGIAVEVRDTVMGDREDRIRLAREILDVAWAAR